MQAHTYTYTHIVCIFTVWRVGVHSIFEAFSTQQLIITGIKEGTQNKIFNRRQTGFSSGTHASAATTTATTKSRPTNSSTFPPSDRTSASERAQHVWERCNIQTQAAQQQGCQSVGARRFILFCYFYFVDYGKQKSINLISYIERTRQLNN